MRVLPSSLFGRFFIAITVIMLIILVVIRVAIINLVAGPGGEKLGTLSFSLMVLLEDMQAHVSEESYSVITKELQKSTGVIVLKSANIQKTNYYSMPFLVFWQKKLDKYQPGNVLSYQETPTSMVWISHLTSPVISLGIPMMSLSQGRIFITAIFVFGFVASIITAFLLSRYLISPLNNLVVAANAMARNIKGITINPYGPKEIQAVGLAMQSMRADLENTIKEQEFLLAGVSHDLRTPLTRIRIATEFMLLDDDKMAEDLKKDIEEIDKVLRRFIELARCNIEESEHWTICSINPLIDQVVLKYKRANIDINLYLCETHLVFYKPIVLERFLYNVIDNAIKYGGGMISISTVKTLNTIDVCIADNGPGFNLSNEQLQAFSGFTSEQGIGVGLGLLIIQRIAKMHDAKLTLRNNPKGGAEIILSLKTYSHQP